MISRSTRLGVILVLATAIPALAGYTSNIMLTGYWPPSNEMLRRFSANPAQNPQGWIGQNWEGRGYNIYSYFPEFTSPPPGDNIGHGDFEVDYQDTYDDFQRITAEIHPLAIITFGKGNDDKSWQLESRYGNWASSGWINDYRSPYKPPRSPPDSSLPAGAYRYSSLPMDDIASAVTAANLGLFPWISTDAGHFLCEYIGYHAAWYHDLHASQTDDYWNIAAGHIHVGGLVTVDQARSATEVTLRTLSSYLDGLIPEPASGVLFLLAVTAAVRRRRR